MPSDQAHWDKAYDGADLTKLGWYQANHDVSLELIGNVMGKK